MVKILGTGIWLVIVALAATYFSVTLAMAPEEDPDAAHRAALETVRGDVTSLPVIADGAVKGYFLTRMSYIADRAKLAEVNVPIDALITDELFTQLVGNKVLDLQQNDGFDLDAFRNQVRDALNARLGDEVIEDVLVEQIDYLSKADIRSNIAQSNLNMQTGEKVLAGEANGADHAAPASGGH